MNVARSIPSLTGIRGVAALWVVLFHIGDGVPGYKIIPGLNSSSFIYNGFRGVDLFFLLSGFIMMHAHAADFATDIRRNALKRFAMLRLFRIYPAHLVVLFMILALVLAAPAYVAWSRDWNAPLHTPAYTLLSFIQTATLTTRWLIPDLGMWNGVTWTLSAELLAYGTLPFLAFWLARVRSRGLCVAIAAASLLAMLGFLLAIGDVDAGDPNRPGLARGFCEFAAGAALYRLVELVNLTETQVRIGAILSTVAIVGLLLLRRVVIFEPFAFGSLIFFLSFQTGIVDQVLRSSFPMFLGRISFPLYLVHATLLLSLCWLIQSGRLLSTPSYKALWLGITLALIFALSYVLHVAIERPSQRLGRSLVRRWSLSPATNEPAAAEVVRYT